MDLSSYRQEYAAYCSAVERERYAHHAGLAPALQLTPVRERHADLWKRDAIDELARKYEETPADFETERAGIVALLSAARRNFLEASAAEVTAELTRCEEAAQFKWDGESVKAEDAPELLARETDAARRRELAARHLDAARPCDDLRAARHEALTGAARSLGLAGCRALYEGATATRLDAFAAQADEFLERTATAYASHLARWAAAHASATRTDALTHADMPRFMRASHLDRFFAARGARAAYAEAMKGLGIHVERQTNIRLDEAERPGKGRRAACFGVAPPADVRLVAGAVRAGADAHVGFFFEAGRAQHFGWTSRETAARHPEFVHAPDDAARAGAGLLFAGFLRDPAWAAAHLSLRESDAHELARSLALLQLAEARRACARLRYALALDDGANARAESVAETYASLHTEATGFTHDPSTSLAEADERFDAATHLRALLFAASLREHLRSAYGRRWHSSRAAGDELIDIWNTSLRYHVEELARLAWGGQLDFDLMAEDLEAALSGE